MIPTSDDLRAHGLLSPEMLDALGEWHAAQNGLRLAMSKLPQWYHDRLQALERLKLSEEITAVS
jgi:hypothetical protein